MKRLLLMAVVLALAGCSDFHGSDKNVVLHFSPYTQETFTKAQVSAADVFSKLNVMLFTSSGEKALDKVKTQTADEGRFGTMELMLAEGTYYVVAVGHSSKVSATIKSLESVQFTASNGEKLTDTFSYYGTIDVTSQRREYTLQMKRVVAMFRLVTTDTAPGAVAKMKFDYTGGSANYNPSTGQGNTRSTQSETRPANDSGVYEVYTFPYMANSGTLTMNVSALDASGNILLKRTFQNVPMTVNTITAYKGTFFEDIPGSTTSTPITFTADPEWDALNEYTF